MKYVITDFGKQIVTKCVDPWQKKEYETIIYQYGAWETKDDYLTDCVEASNDIEYLQKKYNTTEVYKILDK